jgi:hypothetical protein
MKTGNRVLHRAKRALACGLVAAGSVLVGCGGSGSTSGTDAQQTESPASTTSTKRLALHLGAGSYTVSSSRTTLHGTASRGASVAVNGEYVPLHDDRWQLTLSPHVGTNRITVEATMSGHAPVVRSVTITRQPTAAELEGRAVAKREAEVRVSEKRETDARKREAQRESERGAETNANCTNGTYVNAAGNTVCKPENSPTVPAGATARCEDGTYSFSESRSGTCSHHGGVAEWLSP